MDKELAIEVALETALTIIQNGGSTDTADRALISIIEKCYHAKAATIWRLDFVMVTVTKQNFSKTVSRPIGHVFTNLARTARAIRIADDIVSGNTSLDAAVLELKEARNLNNPYRNWFLISAAGINAMCYALITRGDYGALLIVIFAASIGQTIRLYFQRLKMPVAYVTIICGIISASLAALGLRLNISQTVLPTMMASVIYMVPGLPLINGFVDIVSYRFLAIGMERIAKAVFLFMALAVAIAFGYSFIL